MLNIKFIKYYLSHHKNSDLILAHIGKDISNRLFTAAAFAKAKFKST